MLVENVEVSSTATAAGGVLQQTVTSQEALARVPQPFLGSIAWICLRRMALVQQTRPGAKMQSQFSSLHFGPLSVFMSVISK